MDIRKLQAFCKVYELRSFSRAGEELLLSQPTISAHIMALEEELDTWLFDRLGRMVLPTQAGEILYRYAMQVFEHLGNAKADILALKERVAGVLSIGGSTIPAHYLIPELVAGFRAKYPEVRLDLAVGDSREITQAVADGTVDVGLVGAPAEQPELTSTPLLDDELVVVAPLGLPDFPAAGDGEEAARERIASLPWVMREQGSGTRLAFERALAGLHLDVRRLSQVIVVHTTLAALQCVKAGLGVSVTSRLAAAGYLERGEMARLDIPGLAMARSFFAVHHGKRYQFPAMRRFLDYLPVGLNAFS